MIYMSNTLNHKNILKLLTGRDDWRLSSAFGVMGSGRTKPHTGVDYAMPVGTPLLTPDDIEVTSDKFGVGKTYTTPGSGHDYGNWTLFYVKAWNRTYLIAHTKYRSSFVNAGSTYKKGHLMTRSGNTGYSTGPHLHLSVAKGRHSNINTFLGQVIDFVTDVVTVANSLPPLNVTAAKVRVGDYGNEPERSKNLKSIGYTDDQIKEIQLLVNKIIKDEPKNPTPTFDPDYVARKVRRGDYGNEPERTKNLGAAGYSNSQIQQVQNRVNELMKLEKTG